MELPTWSECQDAVERGVATKLEQYIYDNEPAGPFDKQQFRQGLSNLLDEVIHPPGLLDNLPGRLNEIGNFLRYQFQQYTRSESCFHAATLLEQQAAEIKKLKDKITEGKPCT